MPARPYEPRAFLERELSARREVTREQLKADQDPSALGLGEPCRANCSSKCLGETSDIITDVL